MNNNSQNELFETISRLRKLLFSVYYRLRWLPAQIRAAWRGQNLIEVTNERGTFFARPLTDTVGKTSPLHQSTVQQWVASAPAGICIDVGSGPGIFTNTALTKGQATRVFSFEPNPSEYPLLLKHISANSLTAESIHAALAKSAGRMELPPNTVHTRSSSVCGGSGVQVPTVAFDQFAKEHDINAEDIGCIKIAGLGHELSALEGMQRTLHEIPANARLIVEINESAAKDKTIAFIKWCGFELTEQSGSNYLFTKQ